MRRRVCAEACEPPPRAMPYVVESKNVGELDSGDQIESADVCRHVVEVNDYADCAEHSEDIEADVVEASLRIAGV